MAQIEDGTANTFAIGETSRFINQPDTFLHTWAQVEWFGNAGGDPWVPWGSQFSGMAYAVPKINAIPPNNSSIPNPPCLGMVSLISACEDWINQPTITSGVNTGQEWAHMGFRSLHPNGAHFVYLDGTVRFLSADIDRRTFAAMATIRGKETSDRLNN